MTEFQIKEDGRTMIPSVFSHAGEKRISVAAVSTVAGT